MLKSFLDSMNVFSTWLWEYPMLILLLGGGVWMTVCLGFVQFRHFGYILRQTFGKIFARSKGEGSVSAFSAATTALASTIGASNIIGVPVAIAFGGPGAVFWMWLSALLGCALKYAEVLLGVKYRERNSEGNYVGGPMYYLSKGMRYKWLGTLFAFILMIELFPSIAAQSLSVAQTAGTIGISPAVSGIGLIFLVGLVVYGGIKRIAKVTDKLVPVKVMTYLVFAVIAIAMNIHELPRAVWLIFSDAFTGHAAIGGAAGASVAAAMRWGIARGVYSSEAGLGTAAIAHSAAVTDHPARQAMWGVFEVLCSAIIVCSISAFLVLTSDVWMTTASSNAAAVPALVFQQNFGQMFGGAVMTICMFLFVFATILALVFYGEKQAEFLFGPRVAKFVRALYFLAIFGGCIGQLGVIYQFLDILLAALVIPNMIGVLFMSSEVRAAKQEFFNNPELYGK